MSKLRVLMMMALIVLGTSVAEAQFVSMTGDYGEANGRIVNIPQNPPLTGCGAGGSLVVPPAAPGDARCKGSSLNLGAKLYAAPAFGVGVAGGSPITIMGGLAQGDSFTIPPLAFSQNLGDQSGPVVNNAVVQLVTRFQPVLPGTARDVNPPALTRVMRAQGPVPISGQTGRPTGPIITVPMAPTGMDTGSIIYKEGVNKFGGTMAALLDGTAELYIKTPGFDVFFPPTFQPVVGIQPVGDPTVAFNERNGAGWNYPITGTQMAGKVVGPAAQNFVPCGTGLPAAPAGCNEITGLTGAITLDVGNFLASAASTKFFFPWTTGTVTNIVTGFRNGQTITSTITAMGYDTTAATPGVRNVGLVSGSYTRRQSGTGNELASQMIGINLRFTPEPGATVALLAGVGMLGLAAARRRS